MADVQVQWLRLQTFNGSQDAAFEEMCKQLSGAECRSAGGRWIPKGKIDAGVEGYGSMPNGDEWAVQAKWFLTSPTAQQWSQVDESVDIALERHPRLTRYMVCMPTDLSDARTPGTMSARDRWEERRAKYVQSAADRGMHVTFEFWGSHELARELMRVENRGLRSYWFGGPELSPDSVKRRIEDTLSAVGPRYSRKLNVEVPLSRFVDAMTLSERFVERVFEHYRAIRKWTTALRPEVVRTSWVAQSDDIFVACQRLCLNGFASDAETRLSRMPYMLLVGEAGSGKTHFLCDVALRMADAGRVAILVLGREEFDGNSVWGEVARRNGLPSDHEELLGALQAAAEATRSRALLLLDGINEGPDAKFWKRELSVVINQVRRFPRVALVVSVRDTFLDAYVREDAKEQLIEVVHEGFAYDILEAQRALFQNFGIREPSVPLLLPEFANPLFLTLFCKGIVSAGLNDIPRGLSGLTGIFNFFIDAQNAKLSEELDLDPAERLVHRALDALAAALTPQRPNAVERTEAKAIVDRLHFAKQFSQSLFAALEREGFISTMRFGETSYVRFTYERMADHARARRLLEQVGDKAADQAGLAMRIGKLLAEAADGYGSAGLFEALSLQIPERYGHELLALLPRPHYQWQVEALLRALPWRRPESVSEATAVNVFRLLEETPDLRETVVACLLSCALVPGNPLNATGLHTYLCGLNLPQRDALWTIPISRRQYDGSAVLRMTSWARNGAFGLGGGGAAEAAAVTLLWLCTSTNRRVRDDATKGVVAILDSTPDIATTLYESFRDVDDPYVVQRLYAVLAGHAMRTARPTEELARLAQTVLHGAQSAGLPVDLLARDYARTIVERALFLGAIDAEVDISAVRPPYGVMPPNPTDADTALFERYSWSRRSEQSVSEEPPSGLLQVHSSLDKHGDFARYIVGTDSRGDWLAARLSDGVPLTQDQRREAFTASLSRTQARLYKKMLAARCKASSDLVLMLRRVLAENVENDELSDPMTPAREIELDGESPVKVGGTQDHEVETERRFIALLDEKQQSEFKTLDATRNEADRFSLSRATHWMFRRILEMGYGGKEVYAFDERVAREAWEHGEGRQPATIERIGKKYQWIAYFEFLARMGDNYYLQSWKSDDTVVRYDVPLQLLTRDIDPSTLIVTTHRPSYNPHLQSWWAGSSYADWREHVGVDEWMRDSANLPDPKSALVVTDPDGAEWICINTHLSWREREVLLEEKYDVPRRELWYLIFGYLVPKSEAHRAYRWLRRQNFSGGWLRADPHDVYRLHWGELFWSPSFAVESATLAMPPDALENVSRKSTKALLIPATASYMHERGKDNSVLDTIQIDFPIAEIVRGMGGISSDPERGAWLDAAGQTVCIDPSVAQDGPGAVLVRRDLMEAFLRDSPFALVWTLLSEKQIIGGNASGTYHGRLVTSGAYWLHEAVDNTFSVKGGTKSRFED